jgi:stage II sporulation protein D
MRSRAPRIATALAAAAIVLAPSAPAGSVAPPPTDTEVLIGSNTTLTVTGHGWGHGHGMSQWGAQGAALQGLPYDQILAFYYPGTTLSAIGGKIRVLITADTDDNLKVHPTPGLKVVDRGTGRAYRLPTAKHPKMWRLKVVAGHTRIYYRTGRWHHYRPRGHSALVGDGQFKSRSHLLTLRLPTGDRVYRGALRLSGSDTVNVLNLDQYVKGVVPAEAFPSWQPAALQAQAVAARTYAAGERADGAARTYDLCDTSHCQVYRGYEGEYATTNAAVDATVGRILTYQGAPAFAQFSASSGGWTSAGTEPYLVAQPDIYDTAASGDTNLNWTKQVPIATLQSAYPALGTLTSIRIVTRDSNATYPNAGWDQGWVLSITLTGTGSPTPVTIKGTEFQSLYGLKSAYFSLATP